MNFNSCYDMQQSCRGEEGSSVKKRIELLKRERNAVIIAHHYAPAEVHDVADVLSDSRGFFDAVVRGCEANVAVVLAPAFFAEITAAMWPEKKVLVPEIAECPVASHSNLGFDNIAAFKKHHRGKPLVCYATSPLETKLLADYVAFPGEVVDTIENVDADEVLFAGERNCSDDAVKRCGKKVIAYGGNPVCNVYNSADLSDVQRLKDEFPDACIMVHPECKQEVIDAADYVMGTGEMREQIRKDGNPGAIILGTERGFFDRMRNEFPEKNILHLSSYLTCNVFKVLRLKTVLESLEKMCYPVQVDRVVAERIRTLFNRLF
ncbi:hypothetical protein CR164_08005 [Prosthecochloris marina]|uniref:quinolinate synthase n=1 Tax=Prosthecochloris marina TaxID=2017681 RepID=A0A317T4X0_9CHLB|nr:quinolinate synthase NadA [Prosthecochloris marina]PWW81762.1 hypothetical protein CR164_08005 [Prosthecochloris marina]